MSVRRFAERHRDGVKLAVTTCYDYWSAQLLDSLDLDALLVGDSAAMVVHGHPTTIPATAEIIALHVAAVARGAPSRFVIADLPFLAHRRGVGAAMDAVETAMRAGAHAIKLEGVDGHEDVITHIVGSGVPVMGHVGLTPQSVHRFGGYRVQGQGDDGAAGVVANAQRLDDLGCFSIVVEAVPAAVGAAVTAAVTIPTIGIGAGPATDGQVLVLHDLLGLTPQPPPRFVRRFVDGADLLTRGVEKFIGAVRDGSYPSADESYR